MGWKEKNRPPAEYRLEVWEGTRWFYTMWWSGRKRSYTSSYRYPHTTQEIRGWEDDYGRLKRSPTQLPDHRDELMRWSQRSWKRHRKTQYKPIVWEDTSYAYD